MNLNGGRKRVPKEGDRSEKGSNEAKRELKKRERELAKRKRELAKRKRELAKGQRGKGIFLKFFLAERKKCLTNEMASSVLTGAPTNKWSANAFKPKWSSSLAWSPSHKNVAASPLTSSTVAPSNVHLPQSFISPPALSSEATSFRTSTAFPPPAFSSGSSFAARISAVIPMASRWSNSHPPTFISPQASAVAPAPSPAPSPAPALSLLIPSTHSSSSLSVGENSKTEVEVKTAANLEEISSTKHNAMMAVLAAKAAANLEASKAVANLGASTEVGRASSLATTEAKKSVFRYSVPIETKKEEVVPKMSSSNTTATLTSIPATSEKEKEEAKPKERAAQPEGKQTGKKGEVPTKVAHVSMSALDPLAPPTLSTPAPIPTAQTIAATTDNSSTSRPRARILKRSNLASCAEPPRSSNNDTQPNDHGTRPLIKETPYASDNNLRGRGMRNRSRSRSRSPERGYRYSSSDRSNYNSDRSNFNSERRYRPPQPKIEFGVLRLRGLDFRLKPEDTEDAVRLFLDGVPAHHIERIVRLKHPDKGVAFVFCHHNLVSVEKLREIATRLHRRYMRGSDRYIEVEIVDLNDAKTFIEDNAKKSERDRSLSPPGGYGGRGRGRGGFGRGRARYDRSSSPPPFSGRGSQSTFNHERGTGFKEHEKGAEVAPSWPSMQTIPTVPAWPSVSTGWSASQPISSGWPSNSIPAAWAHSSNAGSATTPVPINIAHQTQQQQDYQQYLLWRQYAPQQPFISTFPAAAAPPPASGPSNLPPPSLYSAPTQSSVTRDRDPRLQNQIVKTSETQQTVNSNVLADLLACEDLLAVIKSSARTSAS